MSSMDSGDPGLGFALPMRLFSLSASYIQDKHALTQGVETHHHSRQQHSITLTADVVWPTVKCFLYHGSAQCSRFSVQPQSTKTRHLTPQLSYTYRERERDTHKLWGGLTHPGVRHVLHQPRAPKVRTVVIAHRLELFPSLVEQGFGLCANQAVIDKVGRLFESLELLLHVIGHMPGTEQRHTPW